MATDGYSVEVPVFIPKENYSFDIDAGVSFVAQWNVGASINENSVSVSGLKYSPISIAELKGVNLNSIPTSFKFSVKNSTARDIKYAMVNASAIVKTASGGYNKVTSFQIQFNNSSAISSSSSSANQSVSNSVLRAGAWYKFAVDKTGVFKISKNFLSQMGLI